MAVFHIIGDQDTVLGYRFAGVSADEVTTEDEARKAFQAALSNPEIRILLITEAVEEMLRDQVTAHRMAATPPFVSIVEDIWGPHHGRRSLQDLINEAIGVQISNDEEQS